jgi:Phosphotransferase enzyme family
VETRSEIGDRLSAAVRAAFGADRRIVATERLRGGSKKGVYRLRLDTGPTAIAYVWSAAEDYWPARADSDNHADPFSHSSGLDLFDAAHRRLEALGIRSPRIYRVDAGGQPAQADVALAEDVRGGSLEALLRDDPERGAMCLAQLAEALDEMQRCAGPGFGKVAFVDAGGTSHGLSCEQVVFDRALDDLAEAAARDARIAAVRGHLADRLRELRDAVRPRSAYSLIHGELGPDHVLVDGNGRPVLIDIEGLMYFDVEWEHVFLRIRFGEHYDVFRTSGLDRRRLDLFMLAMRLSLVAGPLRLLDGDFPHRAEMQGIAEHNLQQALTLLASAPR